MNIFGLGPRRYQVKRDWLQLPSGKALHNLSAITNDNQGRIYVLQRSQPFMLVFSYEGELIDEWFNDTVMDGHYVRATKDGRICVADRNNHRIVIFNRSGEIVQMIGQEKNHPGDFGVPFNHPTDCTVNDKGEFFVSDGYGNFHVHHLNAAGELIRSWGGPGQGPGQFTTPHSVLVDRTGRVLVADRENNRVQIFNQQGKYLGELSNLYHPMDIYEDQDGFLYVTDQTPTLSLFTSQGELLGRFLTFGTVGHGVTVDEHGDIYVAEMFHDQITKYLLIA